MRKVSSATRDILNYQPCNVVGWRSGEQVPFTGQEKNENDFYPIFDWPCDIASTFFEERTCKQGETLKSSVQGKYLRRLTRDLVESLKKILGRELFIDV